MIDTALSLRVVLSHLFQDSRDEFGAHPTEWGQSCYGQKLKLANQINHPKTNMLVPQKWRFGSIDFPWFISGWSSSSISVFQVVFSQAFWKLFMFLVGRILPVVNFPWSLTKKTRSRCTKKLWKMSILQKLFKHGTYSTNEEKNTLGLWHILLMEEILHHLGCKKPRK